jgi:hypothetical protein
LKEKANLEYQLKNLQQNINQNDLLNTAATNGDTNRNSQLKPTPDENGNGNTNTSSDVVNGN